MKSDLLLTLAGLAGLAGTALAARIDVGTGSVRANGSKLPPGADVAGGSTLSTGAKSRTQVSVGGRGSVVRAGSSTEAFLRENEDRLDLKKGIMLTSSGRGALGRRDPVAIDTKEATATARGTMMVAYQPESYMKVTCIEGRVAVRLKALLGELVELRAGQMVIINPAEKRLPETVEVDLDELNRTSVLLGGDFPPLRSLGAINSAIATQARAVDEQSMLETSLVLPGAGPEVVLNGELGITGRQVVPEEPPVEQPPPTRPPPRDEPSGGAPPYIPPVEPTPRDFVIDPTTTFDQSASQITTPEIGTVQGTAFDGGTAYTFLNNDPVNSPELLITGAVNIPGSGSFDSYQVQGRADVQSTLTHQNSLSLIAPGGVNVSGSSINGPANTSFDAVSGTDINITGSTISQGDNIAVDVIASGQAAGALDISSSRLESRAGSVFLASSSADGSRAAITVRNSSELLALAAGTTFGGNIQVVTSGGRIMMADSRVAGRDVLIDTTNPSVNSLVELRNMTINADTIRARGFGSGPSLPDALLIEGGTFQANSMIKFYAEGASTLRFRGTVNLESPAAVLAGQRVSVDPGGNVNAPGRLQVFADDHDYNRPNAGNINSQNLSPASYSERPPF